MKGFFSDDEIAKHTNQASLTEANCRKCGLDKKCKSPKMGYTGEGRRKILIIAEAPGKNEDIQGVQLVGDAGRLLRQHLAELNLDLDKDFWKVNSVNCRPTTPGGSNRKPTKTEIKCCKPMVDTVIKELQPHSIWLMGGVAVDSFFTDRFSNTSISRWVGLNIPDKRTGAWVMPLYHPSYIKRREFDANLKSEFIRNLKYAVSCSKLEPYKHEELDRYTTSLTAFDSIKVLLKKILQRADDKYVPLYIDYETTGLKPHWKDSRIATVSIATDRSTAYAFPFQYKDFFSIKEIRKIKGMLRKIMTHPNIGLMAQNMKFEDSWTRNVLGVKPANWMWDTMIASHLIDNRRSFTGLKFQSYIHFGIDPYDKGVSKFLKAPPNSHHNNVDKAPLGELLYYNCLDTLLGMRLYDKQQEEFTLTNKLYPRNNLPKAYNLFHGGILALSDVQENGVIVKEGYYEKKELEVGKDIAEIEHELLSGEDALKFSTKYNRPINLASNKDLGLLFYEILGEKEVKTAKGNYKVDKETIEQMNTPFVSKLLEMRKLEKVRGTYFSQIKREVCDGVIHPFFDLHIPRSGRGSSSRPNWQNQPGHDPVAGKLVRSGIVPPKDWYMAEADYSSIEVKVAALYTQDPSLIKYVTDPTTDMHRDTACDIWLIDKEQVTKNIRFHSKGGWVFSQFYGSYYVNCGEDLWKLCVVNEEHLADGTPMGEHLHDNKIHNKTDFINHLKGVEDIFWNQRFKVYKQWKIDINKQYRRNGFVENFYGFKFSGYMNDKETTNYPIQSTAFHILLEALTEVNRIATNEEWKSYIIGQIHDSILLYIHPDEVDNVMKVCNRVMSKDVSARHDWITVPIDIEFELTDTSWWDKKEVPIPNGDEI
jgi:uracil-DNA glycosylase family 4